MDPQAPPREVRNRMAGGLESLGLASGPGRSLQAVVVSGLNA